MKSKLLYESFSNASKSVNLVSHSLLAYDTRTPWPNPNTGVAGRARNNVFDCILQPSKTGTNRASLQMELHYRYHRDQIGISFFFHLGNTCSLNFCSILCRSTRDSSSFTVVLNNLRVFLIFDWLQLVQDFLQVPGEKASVGAETCQRWPSNTSTDSGPTAINTGAVMPKTVKSGVVTKRSTVPVNQDRCLEVKINITGQRMIIIHFQDNMYPWCVCQSCNSHVQ